MKAFKCRSCASSIYFDNVRCLSCGHALGFSPADLELVTLEPATDGSYSIIGRFGHAPQRYCANFQHGVCNWLVDSNDNNELCRACDLNRIIPNLGDQDAHDAWGEIERAKKRLAYSLLRFGLPLDGRHVGKPPMSFDFVADAMTGHLDGVITIDIDEADDVERARQQQQFAEPYRTVLGHLRHESGHYYWMLLVETSDFLHEFRELFGDDRLNYGTALSRYHENGPDLDWRSKYVSAYAGSHPWEDWAETWAHYLHMVDVVETTQAYHVGPSRGGNWLRSLWPFAPTDVYRDMSFSTMLERWIPMCLTMNELNRSMGHDDFYPFSTPAVAVRKLEFIHRVVRRSRRF